MCLSGIWPKFLCFTILCISLCRATAQDCGCCSAGTCTVTIGSGGTYTTLTAFKNALQNSTVFPGTGLTINATVISDITESGTILFSGNFPAYDDYIAINIGTDAGRTIDYTGTNSASFLTFANWNQNSIIVTIDGDATGGGTKDLTVRRDATSSGGSVVRVSDLGIQGFNIQNCRLETNLVSPPFSGSGAISFTGNVNNLTINNCDIGPTSGGATTNGIFFPGSATHSNVTVTNCNIFNYATTFAGEPVPAGINVNGTSDNFIIRNNRFFLESGNTIPFSFSNNSLPAIFIASGNGHTIEDNVIGSNDFAGSGVMALGGSSTLALQLRMMDIRMSAGSLGTTLIRNNTISKIAFSSNAGGSQVIFTGIYVDQADGTTVIQDNTIGDMTTTGSIAIEPYASFSQGNNAYTKGIAVTTATGGTGTVNILTNTIGGISSQRTADDPTRDANIRVIEVNGSGLNFTINGNTIGGTGIANSISAGRSGNTTKRNEVTGIYVNSASSVDIHNNTIQEMTSYGTGSAHTSNLIPELLFGIYLSPNLSGRADLFNNDILNLTSFNTRANNVLSNVSSNGLAMAGIYVAATGEVDVRRNDIHSLTIDVNSVVISRSIHGILVSDGAAGSSIIKNKIYDINYANGTNGNQQIGISHMSNQQAPAGDYIIENNMIALDAGSQDVSPFGLFIVPAGTNTITSTIRHNTILIEGSGDVHAFQKSAAVYLGTANGSSVSLQNNILFNNHTDATDAFVLRLYDLSDPGLSFDYNFLYDDGTDRNIAYDSDTGGGSPLAYNLLNWKATSINPEVHGWILEFNAHDIDPGSAGNFFTRSNNGDLSINTSTPDPAVMYVFGNGIANAAVTEDIDGDARGTSRVAPTTSVGIPVTIGADQVTTFPGQSLTIVSAAPTHGASTIYEIAGQRIAVIRWDDGAGGAGSLPSSASISYTSGRRLVHQLAGGQWGNEIYAYLQLNIGSGGSAIYTAQIDFYYHPNEVNAGGAAVNPASAQLFTTSDGTSFSYHTGSNQSSASDYIQRTPGITQGVLEGAGLYFGIAGNPSTLPVELLFFKAEEENAIVSLKWTTATELNNDYFTLHKSYDVENFYPLATVQGQGTTSEIHHYSYEDRLNPAFPVVYYQLEQTDYDGTREVLGMVRVGGEFGSELLNIYPNPVSLSGNNTIVLGNVAEGSVSVYAVDGSLIDRLPVSDGRVELHRRMKPGIYLLRTNASTGTRLVIRE